MFRVFSSPICDGLTVYFHNSYLQADISFDQIRLWLCGSPDGPASSQPEVEEEEQRLEDEKKQEVQNEFDSLKKSQIEGGFDARNRQEYEDKTKRLAKRKVNR